MCFRPKRSFAVVQAHSPLVGEIRVMPGQAGLCKNKQCWNERTQKRKQAQSGLAGYCRTCAAKFASDLLKEGRVATNAVRNAAKYTCYRCGRQQPVPTKRPCCQGRRVLMCDDCCAVHKGAVCHMCYKRWHGKCFRCKAAAVPSTQRHHFCDHCYTEHTTQEHQKCYYCLI